PERNGRAGQQHDQGDDKNDAALDGRAHGASPSACWAWARAASSAVSLGLRPNGGWRPVTRLMRSTTYWSVTRPSPIGIVPYGIQSRARHMLSDTQPSVHASCQKLKVSTVTRAQNAIDIRMDASA